MPHRKGLDFCFLKKKSQQSEILFSKNSLVQAAANNQIITIFGFNIETQITLQANTRHPFYTSCI